MTSFPALIRGALLAGALIGLVGASLAKEPTPERSVDMAAVLKAGPLPELALGDEKGVVVVEYGSLTCSHCAAFAHDVFPKLKAAYIDTGKVRFIFREFSRNPLDVAAFVLSRCVGDDKAFAAIELLFAQQERWAFVNNPLEPLISAMRPTGLTHDAAMACIKDQAKADAVTNIGKTGGDVTKLTGTPTFVIDGKVYGGELKIEDFDTILKPLIKQ